MTDDTWHTSARIEQKRRLDAQLADYKASLGHCTKTYAWNTAGLVMGSIYEMQCYALLTAAESAEYQAQVRAAYGEAVPDGLALFDEIWLWDPHNPPEPEQ